MTKYTAIVPSRMTSSRLPGKSLLEIFGKPILYWLIERLKKSKLLNEIIIATTTNNTDDPIVDFCKNHHIKYFRGSENDVLSRVLGAATKYKSDIIVQITGDCPLVDFKIVDSVIQYYNSINVDYVKNFPFLESEDPNNKLPQGMEVEVFKTESLIRLDSMTKDPWIREHVTEPLYSWPEFTYSTFINPKELCKNEYRLCVDTKEDFNLIKTIFENFKNHPLDFDLSDIISFFSKNKNISKINANVKQKKYTAAVIGLGSIGMMHDYQEDNKTVLTHAKAYRRWSKSRLIGAADSDPKQLQLFKNKYEIDKIFLNAKVMLENLNPDIVSIVSPQVSHEEQLKQCLNTNVKAILCEPPFFSKIKLGLELLNQAHQNNQIIAVNHWQRYSKFYQNLKFFLQDLLLKNEILQIYYHYTKGLYNSGTNAFDFIRYIFGEIQAVKADSSYTLNTGEQNIDGILLLKNDLQVNISTSDYMKKFYTQFEVHGKSFMLKIINEKKTSILFYKRIHNEFILQDLPIVISENDSPMLNAVSNLIDAYEKREILYCTGQDGLEAIIIAKALETSLNQNIKIDLKEFKESLCQTN